MVNSIITIRHIVEFHLNRPQHVCQIFRRNKSKRGNIHMYQIATTLPNDHKIYQMAVIYLFQKGHRIYKPFPFHGPPKIAQIGIFGLKKGLPSDNPGPRHMNLFAMNTIHLTLEFLCLRFSIFVFRCADNGNVLKSM
jgi:hypothetical protein